MRVARLAVPLALLVAVGASSSPAAVRTPSGLRGFLLRANARVTHTFHRTPSFAWTPVPGASRYELQVATSSTFGKQRLLYDDSSLQTPVAAPPVTLPWVSRSPYALYARVRAIFPDGGVSTWSRAYGFNVLPPLAPTPLPSRPGLLRWTPVEGAGAYQVLLDAGKLEVTTTNVLDEREYYAFHTSPQWIGTVRWRVRVIRDDMRARVNGMRVATHGPWSPVYTSTNPQPSSGPIRLGSTISDVVSDGRPTSRAHRLMPGFTWTGDETLDGAGAPFFRVYVFSDEACLKPVFVGPVVGSPAYAPRMGGPLAMPQTTAALASAQDSILADGSEANDFGFDGQSLAPTEEQPAATPTASVRGASNVLLVTGDLGAPVDLPDVSWPSSGYYWTVVGVAALTEPSGVRYVDLEQPQDVCAAGRVSRFGIWSTPSLASGSAPYVTGLSSKGRLTTSVRSARCYGEPLVAWAPAPGAREYEVQWSRKKQSLTAQADAPAGARGYLTMATAAVLPLGPGTWWYRVRGFDYNLPTGSQEMAWSAPQRIVVAPPRFRVSTTPPTRGTFTVVGG